MSLDTKQYNRSVYSILNFLGDVGGLLSILLPIGSLFIDLFDSLFDRTLDSHIIKRVFFNVKFSYFACCQKGKKRTKDIATARIEKELDVVNFIRKQMKLGIIIKTIFNEEKRLKISEN